MRAEDLAKVRKPAVGLLRPRPKPVEKYRVDRARLKREWRRENSVSN